MTTIEAMEQTTGLSFHNLTPIVGVEVNGVDLSKPLAPAVARCILNAWHERSVLLVRDQSLSEEQQVRFAEIFGGLNRSKTIGPHHSKTNNAVMFVSNIREDGKLIGAHPDGEMHFHTDQCHQEKPCSATMLYAMEIPSRGGGDTLFVNSHHAYETLPAEVKARIANMRALNAYSYGEKREPFLPNTPIPEGVPNAVHPLVRTHPVTGRKSLYVNRLMTAYIEGLGFEESEELLNFLFDHQERGQFVYAHKWKVGDVVIWDNRCVLHARTDFDASERRLLRRITILGEKPV